MITLRQKPDTRRILPPVRTRQGEALRKPRILFVGEAISLAHVSRPAVLARWAREAGYDVYFACGNSFASVARDEGLTPRELTTIEAHLFYARLSRAEFFYKAAELESYVYAELKLIDEVRPDLIVSDFRLTMDISRTLSGVPLLSLINAHWNPLAECFFPPPPSMPIFRLMPEKIRSALFSLIRPLAFRTFARPLNGVRRRFGLPQFHDFREHYTAGNACAYLDLPELSPDQCLPPGHFFLGPVPWEPRGAAPPEFEKLNPNQRLAYVSLGSTGEMNVLPSVLRALLTAGCEIALSGVNATQIDALHQTIPDLRAHCISAPLLDPRRILERATITVCHGGSGTVYQSLAAGVPLLCLPGNPDQARVAAGLQDQGAGLIVDPSHAQTNDLIVAIMTLLTDRRYVKSARHFRDSLSLHDTRNCWLDFLNSRLPLVSQQMERER